MGESRNTQWRLVAGTILAWILVQLAFSATAFRVDETNIIRIAERIAEHPSDPYGFFINWGGVSEDAFHILANPPGLPLWLAVWGVSFGWSEVVLHVSMIPFGVIALVAFSVLAREFDVSPLVSALLLIASPAFVLAAQVAMPDIAMFAVFLAALAAAMRYRRTGEWWLVAVGFTASAVAPFFKYNGALVGPLLGVIWLYGRGRRRGLLLITIGPAVGLALWSWWSLMVYGRVHILTIAEFQSSGATNILTALFGFFGLAVVPLVLAGMRSPGRLSEPALHVVTFATGALMMAGARYLLAMGPIASLAYGISAAIAVRFAVVCGLIAVDWIRDRELPDALLLAWVAIMLWFQFGLLFASVRYLLPFLPAVILLVLRHKLVTIDGRWFRAGLATCIALVLAIAIGDARTANLYREFVRDVVVPETADSSGRLFFDGHWGFQYYIESIGAKPVNRHRQPRWQIGDVLVIGHNPDPSYDFPTPSKSVQFEELQYRLSPGWPVRTIDCQAWANFYGPGLKQCRSARLPYGFATGANDALTIFRAHPRLESIK